MTTDIWAILDDLEEIEEEIEKLTRAGQDIKRFSLVGYSLGGLVARYAVGLLDSKGFFEKIKPVVSVPIPRYSTAFLIWMLG